MNKFDLVWNLIKIKTKPQSNNNTLFILFINLDVLHVDFDLESYFFHYALIVTCLNGDCLSVRRWQLVQIYVNLHSRVCRSSNMKKQSECWIYSFIYLGVVIIYNEISQHFSHKLGFPQLSCNYVSVVAQCFTGWNGQAMAQPTTSHINW